MDTPPRGVTLIELVMVVFVSFFIVALFEASFIASKAVRTAQASASVSLFLRDAVDDIRLQPSSSLTNRTKGTMAGLGYNIGRQTVFKDAAAFSGLNVMQVATGTPITGGPSIVAGPTSVALLPETGFGDLTFKAEVKILPSSGSLWRVGLLFGYQDSANYQYLSIRAGALEVRKMAAGVESTVYTSPGSYVPSTWYELKVVTDVTGASFYLNGTKYGVTQAGYAPYGHIGFIGFNGAVFALDDVSLSSSLKTALLKFDTQSAGEFPEGFMKKAPAELEGFSADMTIGPYNSSTSILDVSADATWSVNGRPKTMHYETLQILP